MVDRRRDRERNVASAHLRFAAGWRYLRDSSLFIKASRPEPDFSVDVIRAEDLTAFSVAGYGIELVVGDAPVMRPSGPGAVLVVEFTFQHLGERAIYDPGKHPPPKRNDEDPTAGVPDDDVRDEDLELPDKPDEPPSRPEAALPARTSRLVFEVPEGEEIPFTVSGVQEALGRLRMLVHPLATPRRSPRRLPRSGDRLRLPGGLDAVIARSGLLIGPARGRASPGIGGAGEAMRARRDLRRVREILSSTAAVWVGPEDEAPTSIGGDAVVVLPGLAFPAPAACGAEPADRTVRDCD